VAERALLDTGAIVALLHADDQAHGPVMNALEGFRGTLLTSEAVLTESVYLLSRVRGGPDACLEFFIRGAAVLVPSSRQSLVRCKALMEQYADIPMDLADATLTALAEEMTTRVIYTLDRRGFSAYRTAAGKGLEIRP